MPTQSYIFGYGSLVSPADVFVSLGRRVDMYAASLDGWIRDWSVVVDNPAMRRNFVRLDNGSIPEHVLALNVRRPSFGEQATNPNGVLFAVNETDMQALDARESCYHRVEVSSEITAAVPGVVYTYVGLEQYMYTDGVLQGSILPESYVKVVQNGFMAWGGQAYYDEFLRTTLAAEAPVVPTKLRANSDWPDSRIAHQLPAGGLEILA